MNKNTNIKRLTWLILAFFVALSTIFSGVSLFANEESQTNENISVQATGNVDINITNFSIVTDEDYKITDYAAMLHNDNLIVSINWNATSTNSSFQEGDSVSYTFLGSDELAFLYDTTQYENLYDGNGTLVGKWRVVATTTNGKTTGQIEMVFSSSSSNTYSGTLKTDFDIKVNMPNTTSSVMGKAYIDTLYRDVLFCKNDYTINELQVSKTVKNLTRDENHPGWAGDTLEYTITAKNLTSSNMSNILFFDSLDMYSSDNSFYYVLEKYYDPGNDESVDIYLNGTYVVQGEHPKTMGGMVQRYGNWDIPANSTIEMKYKVKILKIEETGLNTNELSGYQRTMTNTATVGGITTSANIEMQFPNLYSTKTVVDASNNNFAEPDEALTYRITAFNNGDATYENMVIKDELIDIYQYFVTPDNNTVTLKIDNVVSGTTYTVRDIMDGNIKVDLQPNSGIEVVFNVTMKDENTLESLGIKDVNKLTNTANIGVDQIAADINANLDIIINKKMTKVCDSVCDDEIIRPGDKVQYEITVKNNSKEYLNKIKLKDPLDQSKQYFDLAKSQELDNKIYIVSDMPSDPPIAPWGWLPSIWEDGIDVYLNSGETQVITFTLVTKETLGEGNFDLNKLENELNGKLTSTAIIHNKYESTASIDAGSPVISIDKSVLDTNGDDYASPEEKLYYKIVVRNDDSATLSDNTQVQDTLSNLLPYIEDPTNTVVEMKFTDKNGIVTTDNSKKVSDLIGGMSVYLEIGQEVELTFAVTLKDKTTISDGIELVNTANANKVSDSVTITTSSKEIPITGIEDDTNIWYLTIGIGVVMASLWLIYYLRKQRRYH